MDLEFDKEIDAILRKAQSCVSVSEPDSGHVDADAIAAFAENAVPEKARLLYVEHFSDCDRCRKQLSFAMQMNPEAGASEKSAAPVVSEAATEKIIPWYQSIFRTPNIALAMGALVLAFSGILGYLVLQNQNNASKATVSQIESVEDKSGGPYLSGQDVSAIPTPTDAPIMSANTASSSANAMANTASALRGAAENEKAASVMSAPAANAAPGGSSGQFQVDGASGVDSSISSQSAEALPKSAAPLQVTTDTTAGAATERDEKKDNAIALKEQPKDAGLAKRKLEDRSLRRDAPPPAAKTVGPLQQNQSNNSYQMSVTRTVSGKTFSNRDGAWYDSAYNGQVTTNVRRGTNEYKKLDSGLRNIADTLGGTVVVVWKVKAYRIQ